MILCGERKKFIINFFIIIYYYLLYMLINDIIFTTAFKDIGRNCWRDFKRTNEEYYEYYEYFINLTNNIYNNL